MKLITKTTWLYLFIITLVLALGGWLIYQETRQRTEKAVERYFAWRIDRTMGWLERHEDEIDTLDFARNNADNRSYQVRSGHWANPGPDRIFDTLMREEPVIAGWSSTLSLEKNVLSTPEPAEPELKPYRGFRGIREINGRQYEMQIYRSMELESQILNQTVATLSYGLVTLTILLLLSSYLLSRFLWRPFYRTLEVIRQYSFRQEVPLQLPGSSTHEFNELNSLFTQMTERLEHDYRNIKEYTENISHEIQTPLAIIRAKTEHLINSENADPDKMRNLGSIHEACSTLSRLSRTLSLISKIDNQEFNNAQQIELKPTVEQTLFRFKELAELKDIEVTAELEEGVAVRLDPYLLDLLLGNLMKNAVHHNFHGGKIWISLRPHHFSIANTGEPLDFDREKLFERFPRNGMGCARNGANGRSRASLGLGLAIVKKISELNNIRVGYAYEKNLHEFSLSF
ncbi:Signal transduction histidine kinase [Catalinimonas alkaloidigena]|uniref:histidine kinase n=1 Tax=Catalinimonas alkaloidigena TaxID=1075417 RepID=A0A1G9A072_9BACT|nr:HAMP domain-containing sensor histidine kinase [Catalinimonas alkaloidigena]SDK19790.1 Signal transduction histidine kinase [Catalinimonas alkaloidigena]